MKKYICLFCNTEHYSKYRHPKFCSTKCKTEYKWNKETLPRILRGETSADAIAIHRRYLIETQGNRCEVCSLPNTWCEQLLTLHVDHIDGNSENNNVHNLRLLCPNCHSQTSTFGNKNSRRRKTGKRKQYYIKRRNKLLMAL